MSLESYRNEALGFEETPPSHRELISPQLTQELELNKARQLITCIELELLEDITNLASINRWATQIQEIMKGFIK